MKKNDEERFVQIMLGMADNFRDSITKEGMTMRFDILKNYDISQVEEASKQIVLTRKYTKMPPIAEFIEAIEGQKPSIADKALVIANEIIVHLNTYGSRTPLLLDDLIATHLMSKRWPYREWASMVIEDDLKWWIKEFCEAYKSYSIAEADLPTLGQTNENIKKLSETVASSMPNVIRGKKWE